MAVRDEQALVIRGDTSMTAGPMGPMTLADTMTMGKVFVESGMFPDIKAQAQAVVIIIAGRELGIAPMQSLMNIRVVQGRVRLDASLMGALLKRTGEYDYNVVERTDERCEIEFTRRGQSVYRSVFTMADAKRAGLAGRGPWQQYPANMLFARALSNGARIVAPDVLAGVYTPDELSDAQAPAPAVTIMRDAPPPAQQRPERPATAGHVAAIHIKLDEIPVTDAEHRRFLAERYGGVTTSKDLTTAQASDYLDFLSDLHEQMTEAAPLFNAAGEELTAQASDYLDFLMGSDTPPCPRVDRWVDFWPHTVDDLHYRSIEDAKDAARRALGGVNELVKAGHEGVWAELLKAKEAEGADERS